MGFCVMQGLRKVNSRSISVVFMSLNESHRCCQLRKRRGQKYTDAGVFVPVLLARREGPTYDILPYRPWTVPKKTHRQHDTPKHYLRAEQKEGPRPTNSLHSRAYESREKQHGFLLPAGKSHRLSYCVRATFPSQLGESLEETGKNGGAGKGSTDPPKEPFNSYKVITESEKDEERAREDAHHKK